MSSYLFYGVESAYRVTLHDTYHRDSIGKAIVRYSLRRLSDGAIIFSGKDLHCSPLHSPASKKAALALLSFLTVPPDSDCAEEFTPSQLEWCASDDCQALSWIALESER